MMKYIFCTLLSLIAWTNIRSQNVSIHMKENLQVCQSTQVVLTIKNDKNEALVSSQLTVKIPCGTKYVASTIIGAAEKNINDLSNPVFSGLSIAKGEEVIIKFDVQLQCEALTCLDAQQAFVFSGTLVSDGTTKNFTSTPVNVDSPHLVITGIGNVYDEIGSFKSKVRTITIRNSRAGRLGEFVFEHKHDPYIQVSTNIGTVISKNETHSTIKLSGFDFRNIGNKDEWLDYNESIVISEIIYIKACYYDHQFVRSDYTATWGCESKTCQQSNAIANIRILPNDDKGDKLSIKTEGVEPDCYDGGTADQKATISKVPHRTQLNNLLFKVDQRFLGRGILVNSVVTNLPGNITYHDKFTNDCGQEVAKYITIYVDKFEADGLRKEFAIDWKTAFCEVSNCDTKENGWVVSYEYHKQCSADGDSYFNVSKAYKDLNNLAFYGLITATDTTNKTLGPPKLFLYDGLKGYLHFNLNDSRFLGHNNDTLRLQLTIPKGIVLLDKKFILGGKSPISIVWDTSGTNQLITLIYVLPFDNESNKISEAFVYHCNLALPPEECKGSYASCICNEVVVDKIIMSGELFLDKDCPDGFRPVVCGVLNCEIKCDNIHPCYKDTLDGSIGYKAKVYRTSYGKMDLDYDANPDSVQVYYPDTLRLDRLLPGDSFNIQINGSVVTDLPGATFDNVVFRIDHNLFISNDSLTSDFYRNLIIGPQSATSTYYKHVKIRQKKTQKLYQFDQVSENYQLGSYYLYLSADSLRKYNPNTSFPADYRYSEGDSIEIIIKKRIDMQRFLAVNDQIKVGQFFQFTYGFHSFIGNDVPPPNFPPSPCDCDFIDILFPPFLMSIPNDLSYDVRIPNAPFCFDQNYNQSIFDFSFGYLKAQPLPIGHIFPFEIRESLGWKRVVLGKHPDYIFGDIDMIYANKTYKITPMDRSNHLEYDLQSMIPKTGAYYTNDVTNIAQLFLNFDINKCSNLHSNQLFDFKVYFDLNDLGKLYFPDSVVTKLKFSLPKPTIKTYIYQKEATAFSQFFEVGFSITGPSDVDEVDNIFIKLTNPTGNLKDLKIRDTLSNRMYIAEDGYFQMGKINKNAIRNFSISGKSSSCGSEVLYIEYGFDCTKFSNPALQPCFRAFDTVLIHFPKGLVDLITDTIGAPQLVLCDTTIQKTTFFNAGLGNAYQMKIQLRLPSGLKYVPGSGFIYYPARQTVTGFAIPDPKVNAQQVPEWDLRSIWPQHNTYGLDGAGFFPDNEFDLVYKAVSDCDITAGVPITYNIQALSACGTITNKVTKNSQAIDLEGISPLAPIHIDASLAPLDQCHRYSYKLNIAFDNPRSEDAKLLLSLPPSWHLAMDSTRGNLQDLIPGLENGIFTWQIKSDQDKINLQSVVINDSGISCLSELISIYIAKDASVTCIATGQACQVGSLAGEITLPVSTLQSEFNFSNINAVMRDGKLTLESELEQISGQWYGPLNAIVFVDKNANGMQDQGENSVGNMVFEGFSDHIKRSKSVAIIQNLSMGQLCQLAIIIPISNYCICQDLRLPLRNINFYKDGIDLCSNEQAILGINAMQGYDYQWNNAVGLSCSQCPNPIFSVNNDGNSSLFFERILTVSKDNCQQHYHQNITVNPLPKLLTNDLEICAGDTIRAIATMAQKYQWSGPDVIVNHQQILVARPSKSATYTVQIEDGNGCKGIDSFYVSVVAVPTYKINHPSVLCADTSAELNIQLVDAQSFIWSEGVDRLSNPLILNPKLEVFEDFIFKLQMFNGPCKNEATIPVKFYPPDSTNKTVDICKGQSYFFDFKEYSEPGKYCKTLKDKQGCDSLSCITLTVHDVPDLSSLPDTLYKEINIDLTLPGPFGYDHYSWSPPTGLSCTSCPNPITTVNDTITYTIEVSDQSECKVTKRIKILLVDHCDAENVDLPNAFSPNEDGTNDFYTLGDIELCKLSLRVYNRWGNLVFEAPEWDNHWDGRAANGQYLPQGTYFVEIRFDSGIIKTTMLDLRKK